jgi:hypothetical protein
MTPQSRWVVISRFSDLDNVEVIVVGLHSLAADTAGELHFLFHAVRFGFLIGVIAMLRQLIQL